MSKMKSAPKNFKFAGNIYRTLAIAFTVASLLVLFLPMTAINGDSLQTKIFSLFTASASGMVGLISTIMRFGFVFLMLATATLSIIAIVKPETEESFIPTAALLFLVGCGGYSLSVMACSLAFKTFAVDVVTLILSIAGLAVFGWLVFSKNAELFLSNLLQFALTLGYSILVYLSLGTVLNQGGIVGVLALLLLAASIANMVFECIRLQNEGNLYVDRIRFFAAIGVAVVSFLITLGNISGLLLSLLAIAFALGEVELTLTKIRRSMKNERFRRPEPMNTEAFDAPRPMDMPPPPFARPMPMPSPMAAAVNPNTDLGGFRLEEYAEACPYEGGPISGVEMAEEVNPTFTPDQAQPNQVYTAGYDFYNCKSFDPFIATLDMEERNQFTELFILKYKGVMPEIPDYEVGGDNREFFRKIFIYLGQYRDRIPSGLLTKIYNFSIKLS